MDIVQKHLNYTNDNGDQFQLVPGTIPYHPANHACVGCAFRYGNSPACRDAPSCTPTDGRGNRLVPAGYLWVAVA